jgi:hypothetical protein
MWLHTRFACGFFVAMLHRWGSVRNLGRWHYFLTNFPGIHPRMERIVNLSPTTGAGSLGLLPKAGGLQALTRGGRSKERDLAHGSFLLAMCLKDLMEDTTPHAALARWWVAHLSPQCTVSL